MFRWSPWQSLRSRPTPVRAIGTDGLWEDRLTNGTASPSRRNLLVALGVFLAAGVILTRSLQSWVHGDGPQLIYTYLFGSQEWIHVLYMPVVLLLDRCGLEGLASLKCVSVLGGALGAAATVWMASELGYSLRRSLAAGVLCLLAPTAFFFSTTIEVPALHLGVVALACAVLLSARRAQQEVHFRIAAVGLVPLLYLAHKSSALLAPGWLVLVLVCVAERRGARPSRKEVLAWGAVLATAFLVSILLAQSLVPGNSVGDTLNFIARFDQPLRATYLKEAVWGGLGVLTPLGCLGILRAPLGERLSGLAFVLPVGLFFTWYGETNYGGYYISTVPFLAALSVRCLPRGRAFWLVFLVVCSIQGVLTRKLVKTANVAFNERDFERKVAATRRALGENGLLVSFDPSLQPVTLSLPSVAEQNLRNELFAFGKAQGDPMAGARELLRSLRQTSGTVPTAIDLGGLVRGNARARPFLSSLASALELEIGPADRYDPEHPMLRLEQ